MKTMDQIDDGSSSVYEATPLEQEDVKSIDQIDDGRSSVYEATPLEQGDMKTIDQLNKKFPESPLTFAAEGVKKRWKGRRLLCSPEYTTSWKDLLNINLK